MNDIIASRRLIPTPGPAPEDIIAGPDGMLYCGPQDGRILRLDPDTEAVKTVATVPGRPLGLEPLPDGRLLVCNSPNGLMRVDPATGRVESLLTQIGGKRLIFASNVEAARDGTVWFTASSMRYTQPQWRRDLIEAIPTGHLIRLDPDGRATVLADDLHFANGMVLAADESHLIYAETAARRLSRWWLTGPNAGQRELMCELPGYPDNLGRGADGMVWAAMPTRFS
ncbi:SMP-30/gluconolactonase/LRE family protein [Tropicimonas isoalkanivorans]|uniref:SMP-30/Gluconolaconase/LRE-like region-containing protein n=1 Tax=Tropicimonas isoalkanivorans TaxID=441112 RepID=A0A1I1R0T6_9RHOB|nr:SMP-30/gluconolactonase/LRE family protein [Tropicimonas isoalkanivorans]SFD27925.1 SMP-30/Gluconolaconase/LRE-like region-containing protein [Tropicimonas isoalkanivorans]